MGRCIYPNRRFWSRILRNSSEICFPKEIMCLSIIYCRQLKFFRKFSGDPLEIPFLPNDKFGVKRPQLSKNKKIVSISPGSVARRAECAIAFFQSFKSKADLIRFRPCIPISISGPMSSLWLSTLSMNFLSIRTLLTLEATELPLIFRLDSCELSEIITQKFINMNSICEHKNVPLISTKQQHRELIYTS